MVSQEYPAVMVEVITIAHVQYSKQAIVPLQPSKYPESVRWSGHPGFYGPAVVRPPRACVMMFGDRLSRGGWFAMQSEALSTTGDGDTTIFVEE